MFKARSLAHNVLCIGRRSRTSGLSGSGEDRPKLRQPHVGPMLPDEPLDVIASVPPARSRSAQWTNAVEKVADVRDAVQRVVISQTTIQIELAEEIVAEALSCLDGAR